MILKSNSSSKEKLHEMEKIFEDFFNFYIVDVIILVYFDNLLHMYTYKPYKSEHCAYTKPMLVKSFDKVPSYLCYEELYPRKLKNFYGCPLKVVLWNVPPFVELQRHNNQIVDLKGYDTNVLRDLATFLNFSIDVLPNEPPHLLSGQIFKNETTVGVFKIVSQVF